MSQDDMMPKVFNKKNKNNVAVAGLALIFGGDLVMFIYRIYPILRFGHYPFGWNMFLVSFLYSCQYFCSHIAKKISGYAGEK